MVFAFDEMRYKKREADVLRLTSKGIFLLHAPFTDPAITYFMAASTLIHAEIFEGSKCFAVHDPSGNGPRRFVPATIKTGLSLLRHVQCAHDHEMRKAASYETEKMFALPSLDTWIHRAIGYCTGFGRVNRPSLDNLLTDLRGIAR